MTIEEKRLQEHYSNQKQWLKWGPYLSERQWGTVREDYSANGDAWNYLPFDHSRSKVYRWGEDGIAGICNDNCQLCFAVTMWNGKDPILKERLFGLSGPEGNHGEDVKELYYYLDSSPTHSYMKHLYKYPIDEFPYEQLYLTNQHRSRKEREYEILDTGVFENQKYFDVFTEYAKQNEEDIFIRITVHNRYSEPASIHLLPTIWFRNEWAFHLITERPDIRLRGDYCLCSHPDLGAYHFYFDSCDKVLFTENETNKERLYGVHNDYQFVKDAFHYAVVQQDFTPITDQHHGTKCAPYVVKEIEAGGSFTYRLRLTTKMLKAPFRTFKKTFEERQKDCNDYYASFQKPELSDDLLNIQRQALAGTLWTKQYYNIDIPRWLNGDPGHIPPPEERKNGRNSQWRTLNNEDIISMPCKWEYPWYAAWDLAFHCIPLAYVDMEFAKNQLILILREWYMRPNGQIPAYEWSFGDVNPPVQAHAAIEIFRLDQKLHGNSDYEFLKRVFHKLTINFTWWVNRKDSNGNNVFEGGFLGLDNISVFDRSNDIPDGAILEQVDGTAWMAMYSLNMLEIALILAKQDRSFEDMATKYFEHFVHISASINQMSAQYPGAWDEEDGFFYDMISVNGGKHRPIKVRSLVGLSTLFAVLSIEHETLQALPDFAKRMRWFRKYRMTNHQYLVIEELENGKDVLLSLAPRKRVHRILEALLDEKEFFGPAGIRSLSKMHEHPYQFKLLNRTYSLKYEPGESTSPLFGGNSNWRGPVWFPMNYLILHSLAEYRKHYEKGFTIECPTNTGRNTDLQHVIHDVAYRLINIFTKDENGKRPYNEYSLYETDPYFKDLILFFEYFDGDTAAGLGASHQTGWTALVAELIQQFELNLD